MTVRRWLPWIVALAVVAVTTVVVLTVPNRHVCPPATHPIQAVRFGLLPIDAKPTAWVCASDDSATLVSELGVDRRIPVRLGIALVGVALGVAMGFALHKAYPAAPRSTATSQADTIRADPVEGG